MKYNPNGLRVSLQTGAIMYCIRVQLLAEAMYVYKQPWAGSTKSNTTVRSLNKTGDSRKWVTAKM
jgi:hypothetical protein